MKSNKIQLLLVISVSLLIGYFFGVNKVNFEWNNYHPQLSLINKEPPPLSTATIDMSQFWNVWDKVSTMYYDKKAVDPQKMLNGAIEGMVSSLNDPFSMYLPPVQNTSFQKQLAGKFEGIGAELGLKDKQVIVIAPLDGSPSQKAGIRAGDAIVKVDNLQVAGMQLPQVVDKIRGDKGTKVVLTVLHKGDKELSVIPIIRDTITVKSVSGWVKKIKDIDELSDSFKAAHPNQEVMYIRLSQFGDATNKDWLNLVSQLNAQMQKDGNVIGVVYDERNNPGGYLEDAVFVASEFLKQGSPVVTEDRGNGDTNTLTVNRQGLLLNAPLVVLLNGGSASASEIVAGALRDNGRAKLVGEQSFGKGTVQQALDLGQGSGLHITIAKWLTPKGTWVHMKGLTPDVLSSFDPKDPSHDSQLESAIQTLLK